MEQKNGGESRARRSLRLLPGLFATVVGLCNIVAQLSGLAFLGKVGNAFGLSPAPNPYSYFAHGPGVQFGCEDATGRVTWHPWDYRMRSEIPGPHRRAVTFIAYFAQADLWRETGTPIDGFELRTRYYFCNGGPFALAAGCPRELRAVRFDPKNSRRIACAAE